MAVHLGQGSHAPKDRASVKGVKGPPHGVGVKAAGTMQSNKATRESIPGGPNPKSTTAE